MLESVTGTGLLTTESVLVEDLEYLLIKFVHYKADPDSDGTGNSRKEMIGFNGGEMVDWII